MVKPEAPPAPTVPTAIKSRDEAVPSDGVEEAIFGSGCFWGTEYLFTKYYGHLPGFEIAVGYTGGKAEADDPRDYKQVCTGETNHAESVRIRYQKGSVGYGELVEFFYRTHDPTTLNSQGRSKGTQYRSSIFYHTPEQAEVARQVTAEVQDKYFKDTKIVTEITPASVFYTAEEYHQKYLDKNPEGYLCATHSLHW